ncbi:MAG TPA: hypothetical protein VG206_09900 [Terriglobia bacterium]|nr:hypothetical protein [Terriglobia bacterium]
MNKGSGTAIFLAMRAEWYRMVSPSVARRDPEIVIRFLELNNREEGISQSELARKLRMAQPAVSKLTRKFIWSAYIVRLSAKGDGPRCQTRTTDKGKDLLRDLDQALRAALPGKRSSTGLPRRRRKIWPVAGQQVFKLPE